MGEVEWSDCIICRTVAFKSQWQSQSAGDIQCRPVSQWKSMPKLIYVCGRSSIVLRRGETAPKIPISKWFGQGPHRTIQPMTNAAKRIMSNGISGWNAIKMQFEMQNISLSERFGYTLRVLLSAGSRPEVLFRFLPFCPGKSTNCVLCSAVLSGRPLLLAPGWPLRGCDRLTSNVLENLKSRSQNLCRPVGQLKLHCA